MIIEKVNILVPFLDPVHGTFLQIKLGADVILQEGDKPADAWNRIIDEAEAWHRERYGKSESGILRPPTDSLPNPLPEIRNEKPIPEEERKNSLIADIQSCKEIKVLESYKLLAKAKPELQSAYDLRYKELTENK